MEKSLSHFFLFSIQVTDQLHSIIIYLFPLLKVILTHNFTIPKLPEFKN